MMKSLKQLVSIPLAIILVLTMFSSVSASEVTYDIKQGTMKFDGLDRTYKYYIPTTYTKKKSVPLMLSFHGSGSSAAGQILLTDYQKVAEKEGFIVVFPDSTVIDEAGKFVTNASDVYDPTSKLTRRWNIGAEPGTLSTVNDVGFTAALIDHFNQEYNIDERRVYATGMSYGGFFSNHLAVHMSDRIAGIGAVTGQMAFSTSKESPSRPVTTVYVMGDKDPTVPPAGRPNFILSVTDSVSYWINNNKTVNKAQTTYLPQIVNDGTRIRRDAYGDGKHGTEVILYTVENGGHTWPGGPQYLGVEYIGIASQQMKASEVIWNELKDHKIPGKKDKTKGKGKGKGKQKGKNK
ncbi:alpha/beta hydrolase family esterase [Cytobacillus sp. FJAT-54145]|uniref:Alpha/beta hydrolase family esterase n=1 Tax=Cytobacillus spartinae TaxID=3299023 RepID=A0ABW6K5D0_9BACI